jgi:hypothetical protein
VFLVNLPFSVVALGLGVRLLDEVRDPDAHKSDLLGAGLLTVAVASLVAGIVEGSDWGWSSGRIIGAFALATVTGAGVVVRSFRHPNPIIEPAVIRHRAVALADLSSLAFFGGFGAMVLGGVLLLTGVWHESVLRAGFMIAPGPLLAGLTAFPGGLLGARFGHRVVGTVGSLFFAAGGVWWITHVSAVPDWTGAYLRGSLRGCFGVGLMLPSLGGAATAPLPPQRFATGSALYAMTRQIGIALGVACLVAILGTATGATAVTAFHHAWAFMVGCSLLAGLLLQGIGSRVTETADASVCRAPAPVRPGLAGSGAAAHRSAPARAGSASSWSRAAARGRSTRRPPAVGAPGAARPPAGRRRSPARPGAARGGERGPSRSSLSRPRVRATRPKPAPPLRVTTPSRYSRTASTSSVAVGARRAGSPSAAAGPAIRRRRAQQDEKIPRSQGRPMAASA